MLYEELSKFQFSPSLYISGKRALNVLDSQNQTGDWHRYDAWHHPDAGIGLYQVVGKGCQLDITPYLGDLGVFHANELVYEKMGLSNFGDTVYCATHARAIADLVIAEAFLHRHLGVQACFAQCHCLTLMTLWIRLKTNKKCMTYYKSPYQNCQKHRQTMCLNG